MTETRRNGSRRPEKIREKICEEEEDKCSWEKLPWDSKIKIFSKTPVMDTWKYRAINRECREIISAPDFRKWFDKLHSDKCLLLYSLHPSNEITVSLPHTPNALPKWIKLLYFEGKTVVNASHGLVLFIDSPEVLYSSPTGRVRLKHGKIQFVVYNCLTKEFRNLPDLQEARSVQEDIRYELFFNLSTYATILADPETCSYQVVLMRYIKPTISSRFYWATVYVYESGSSSWSKFQYCSELFTSHCAFVFLDYKLLCFPISHHQATKCCYDLKTKEQKTFVRYFRSEEDALPRGQNTRKYFYTGKIVYMVAENAQSRTMFLYRFYEDSMTFGRLMSCPSCISTCEVFACYEESNEFWAFSRRDNKGYCFDIRSGACILPFRQEGSSYYIGCVPLRMSMVP